MKSDKTETLKHTKEYTLNNVWTRKLGMTITKHHHGEKRKTHNKALKKTWYRTKGLTARESGTKILEDTYEE